MVREETCYCHYMGYSFRLTVRGLLYAPSYRQDSTYHSLCYTSRGALADYRWKEVNVSYLQFYGLGYMRKGHSDSDRVNLQSPFHGLLFIVSSKESVKCTIPQTLDSTYHSHCYTSCGALIGVRNS